MAGNPSFEVFKLPDEHNELRAVLRDLCEKPRRRRRREVTVPQRGAQGAQRVRVLRRTHPRGIRRTGCRLGGDLHRHRRGARVDASASLIPAVNKLGTMGLILSGSEDLKKQVLPSVASGEAMASYALSERESGSDAAAMRTRARADGDSWILNGTKSWITNGGKSTWYTVMASTDPDKGSNGISALMVHKDDEGFTVGPKERKLGIKGSPTTELHLENCRIPGDRIIGKPGTGFKTALATLDHTRPTIGAQVVGIAQGALDAAITYSKERKQFHKRIIFRVCSSCLPTWR